METKKSLKCWATAYPQEFKYAFENNLLPEVCSKYNWDINLSENIYINILEQEEKNVFIQMMENVFKYKIDLEFGVSDEGIKYFDFFIPFSTKHEVEEFATAHLSKSHKTNFGWDIWNNNSYAEFKVDGMEFILHSCFAKNGDSNASAYPNNYGFCIKGTFIMSKIQII